jgi:hypothetical protein
MFKGYLKVYIIISTAAGIPFYYYKECGRQFYERQKFFKQRIHA